MEDKKRKFLTADQAKSFLRDGDDIHVFLNPNGMLVGADWSRKEILKLIDRSEKLEVGGSMSIQMGHGLVATNSGKCHFIESEVK